MNSTVTTFDTYLVPLYRAAVIAPGERAGTLALVDDGLLNALVAVLTDPDKFGVSLSLGESGDLALGITVSVNFAEPRIGLGLLADTFADVLRFPRGTIRAPRYFLLDKKLAYSDPELGSNSEAIRYNKLLTLLELLGESAAYFDKETPELVFVNGGKVGIPVAYQVSDLLTIDLASLDLLIARFQDETHREQKLAMLAESVLKQCSGVEPQRRFAVVLSHLRETLKSFDDNYRLFMADFSYERVRDELQSAKIEELTKIHKTFADVQGQILGIPVATVLVATQMKVATGWDSVAWINTSVLAGVWVFAILVFFVIRNQQHTLNAIDQEIQRKKIKIASTYAPVKDLVSEIFPDLNKRLSLQRWAFRAVDFVVAVGMLLAHIMYFALTEPALRFLKSLSTGLTS